MRWPRGLGGVAERGRGAGAGTQHPAAQPARPPPAGTSPPGCSVRQREFGSFGGSRGREGATLFAPALARSVGDEIKFTQLGQAWSGRAPGSRGGAKTSGGSGRRGPHLSNRVWAQAASDPKGLAEQFVVQPRGIC